MTEFFIPEIYTPLKTSVIGPPAIVQQIRQDYPTIPIMATAGKQEADILATIAAGANALTYTSPTNGELFAKKMNDYRLALE